MDLAAAEDIVFQILLRLPVIALLRFRCVCKQWCAVIESSFFKDTYLAVRRARDVDEEIIGLYVKYKYTALDKFFVLGCYSDYESFILSASARTPQSSIDFEIPAWSPPPSEEPQYLFVSPFRIIGHVDGLICVRGQNWFDIAILNPALREYRKLPILNLGGSKCHLQCVGFGYDRVTDDYKVVAIVTVCEQDSYESPYKHLGIVYRLSTNSWTLLGDMSGFISKCYVSKRYFSGIGDGEPRDESVFSHGVIYWCIGFFWPNPIFRILAFNTSTELFHEIEFPHGWTNYEYCDDYDDAIIPSLFNVDKSTIALVGMKAYVSSKPLIQVWVMKQYGDNESWTKQYSISDLFIRSFLSFWRKHKLILVSGQGFFICYDLLEGQLCGEEQPLNGWGADEWGADGWNILVITGHESFVSVKPVSNQEDQGSYAN